MLFYNINLGQNDRKQIYTDRKKILIGHGARFMRTNRLHVSVNYREICIFMAVPIWKMLKYCILAL